MAQIINPYRLELPPFPPDSLAGLVRWYSADSFSLADGDAIGDVGREWVDQSPTAPNNATQVTPANRPIFKTNIFGTLPAINFFDQFLNMSNITLAGELTVIVVASAAADSVIVGSATANIWFRLHIAATNIDCVIAGGGVASDVFTGSTPNMSTWRRDAADLMTFRERDIARGSATRTGTGIWNLIGGTTGAGISSCNVGEICIYSQIHSDADIDKLYNRWFKPRWGLP